MLECGVEKPLSEFYLERYTEDIGMIASNVLARKAANDVGVSIQVQKVQQANIHL